MRPFREDGRPVGALGPRTVRCRAAAKERPAGRVDGWRSATAAATQGDGPSIARCPRAAGAHLRGRLIGSVAAGTSSLVGGCVREADDPGAPLHIGASFRQVQHRGDGPGSVPAVVRWSGSPGGCRRAPRRYGVTDRTSKWSRINSPADFLTLRKALAAGTSLSPEAAGDLGTPLKRHCAAAAAKCPRRVSAGTTCRSKPPDQVEPIHHFPGRNPPAPRPTACLRISADSRGGVR